MCLHEEHSFSWRARFSLLIFPESSIVCRRCHRRFVPDGILHRRIARDAVVLFVLVYCFLSAYVISLFEWIPYSSTAQMLLLVTVARLASSAILPVIYCGIRLRKVRLIPERQE